VSLYGEPLRAIGRKRIIWSRLWSKFDSVGDQHSHRRGHAHTVIHRWYPEEVGHACGGYCRITKEVLGVSLSFRQMIYAGKASGRGRLKRSGDGCGSDWIDDMMGVVDFGAERGKGRVPQVPIAIDASGQRV
jgi:hypothetical protein